MAWSSFNTPGEFFGPGYTASQGRISLRTDTLSAVVGTGFQGSAADNTLTFTSAHGLSVGDVVRVAAGGTLPTGLAANTDYYVCSVISTTVITLSATLGGAAIDLTTDGSAANTLALRAPTVGTTFQAAADDVLTFAAPHGLIVGDKIKVTQGTTLPDPLTNGGTYFVKTVPATDKITLSETRSGSTVDLTTSGTGDNTAQYVGPLNELTDTETNASTGDVRKVLYGMLDAVYQKWLGIPTADRPSYMTVSMSPTISATTGRITKFYQFSFVTEPTGVEVVDEP